MATAEYDYDMDLAVQADEKAAEAWEGGMKEGRKEGVNDVAKSMLLQGIDLHFVMDCAGFSKEQVLSLQQAL